MRFTWQLLLFFSLFLQAHSLASQNEFSTILKSELNIKLNDNSDNSTLLIGADIRFTPSKLNTFLEQKTDESDDEDAVYDQLDDSNIPDFMSAIDKLLLEGDTAKHKNCGRAASVIGALFGTVPIVPATGVLRKTTRYLLDLPKSTALGNAAIATTVISLLLPYMGQFAQGGKALVTGPSNYFFSSKNLLKAKKELMFSTSRAHKAMIGLMGVAVFVNSLTRLVQMAEIEKVLWFVAGTGPFYFGADFELNFSNGKREIDDLFYGKVYPKEQMIKSTHKFLQGRIRAMKKAISLCDIDSTINERYRFLIEHSRAQENNQPWEASWLIMKPRHMMSFENSDAAWYNYTKDNELFGEISPRRKVADAVAKMLICFGTWGRFEIVSHGTDAALIWLGLDPSAAQYVSRAAAGFATIGAAFWEANLHHNLMRNLFYCAESDTSPDNMATQLISAVPAAVAAFLFTTSSVALGIEACAHYPILGQAILISSSAALNFSSYFTSMYRCATYIVSPIATVFRSQTNKKKAALINQCTKLEGIVGRLTDNATKKFYGFLAYKSDF
ncbi:MAG: hypothetical protein WCG04_02070 [Alphaproteobacteria bacterium]